MLYGCALLAVDVLGVAETELLKVLASEIDVALGPVERHSYAAGVVDRGDLSAGAVLHPGLSWSPVLFGERDQVSFAQPVVLVRQRNLRPSEFAAFNAEVLCAGVEPVDLDV